MAQILTNDQNIQYSYREFTTEEQMRHHLRETDWVVVIYNHYEGNMPWIADLQPRSYGGVHLALVHEVTQESLDSDGPEFFDGWIVTDPSLDLKGKSDRWFQTVRPLPWGKTRSKPISPDTRICIGSFGFAFPNKGFHLVARAVNEAFDEAVLNMHVTKNFYSDGIAQGDPLEIQKMVEREITKPGIELQFSSEYCEDYIILHRLAQNDLNCLFYESNPGRGISSAVDYCVAAGAPLLVSDSEQFRHIHSPELHWPERTLQDGLTNGSEVQTLQRLWARSVFRSNYAGILRVVTS